jgi:hypothetical protein
MNLQDRHTLWLRWVGVNAFGEMFGLGLTFAVGAAVISSLGDQQNVTSILVAFVVAVASGAIEATIVGLAQWWAMHPWFPMITRRAWWLATLVGALLAYVMGYMPSTLMSLGEQSSQSQAAVAEPEQWMVLLLAAGLGMVGGAVLSFAQWLTMRKKVAHAFLWIPANMLAWMVGMPIIFWGIDVAQKLSGIGWVVLFIAGVLLLTGMVVGAIQGTFLVRLAMPEKSPGASY